MTSMAELNSFHAMRIASDHEHTGSSAAAEASCGPPPPRMSPAREKRIIRILAWRNIDFIRALNRAGRTSYRSGDVWKWLNGGLRGVPYGIAIFLRLSVRIAILE